MMESGRRKNKKHGRFSSLFLLLIGLALITILSDARRQRTVDYDDDDLDDDLEDGDL